jgi:hypothetical protein
MRKELIILHTALAAFFLPMGLMYAITGGLYGLGVTGEYVNAEHSIALTEPLTANLSTLTKLAENELRARNMPLPSGSAGVKKGGTSFHLEWTGANHDLQLHPTTDPLLARLVIKKTTPHRFFVQLHKAKGGPLFTWFAALWAIGLILLFLTGGILAIALKPYRKLAVGSVIAGMLTFFTFAFMS